jgi:hypothetical protein
MRNNKIPCQRCSPQYIDRMYANKVHDMQAADPKRDPRSTDIYFNDFVELLLRVAHALHQQIPSLASRVSRLLKTLFQQTSNASAPSADPHDFRDMLANSSAEYIFERHNRWLNNVFQAYCHAKSDRAKDVAGTTDDKREASTLSLEQFEDFVADTELVTNGLLSFRTVKQLFKNAQMDNADRDIYGRQAFARLLRTPFRLFDSRRESHCVLGVS